MTERAPLPRDLPEGFRFELASEGTMRYVLPPDLAEWFAHAEQCLKAREFRDAERFFRWVLQFTPDCALAHYVLAITLRYTGRPDLALDHASAAVRLASDSLEARLQHGFVLLDLQHVEAALTVFNEAVTRWPEAPRAHISRGQALLLLGRFAEGWPEWEWRTQDRAYQRVWQRYPERTRWDGGPLRGRTLLLYNDGGFGDAMQFVRYVPALAACGGRVVLEVRPELVRLLDGFPGLLAICTPGHGGPPFDVHASLFSLPFLFRTDLESIPASIPYLRPPGEEAMASTGHAGLRVGVVWAGSGQDSFDHVRSTALTDWQPVLELPGVTFVSVQVGPPAGQLTQVPFPILDAAQWVRDFADTAALLRHLDLVITVDTAVAHLAGAMGLTTWLLLAMSQDARWLLRREDSPWYPTMRLFRQRRYGDWADVFRRVADQLAAWVKLRSAETPR